MWQCVLLCVSVVVSAERCFVFWASGLWTLFVGDGYIYLYIMKQYASAAWKRGGADQKVPTLVRASSTLPYAHEQFFALVGSFGGRSVVLGLWLLLLFVFLNTITIGLIFTD